MHKINKYETNRHANICLKNHQYNTDLLDIKTPKVKYNFFNKDLPVLIIIELPYL